LRAEKTLSDKQLEMAERLKAPPNAQPTYPPAAFIQPQTAHAPAGLDVKAVVHHSPRCWQRNLSRNIDMPTFSFCPEPLLIHADASMVDQVLLNLTVKCCATHS